MPRYVCTFEFGGEDLVRVMHALHACPGVHELSFEVLHSIPPPDRTDVDACPPTEAPSRMNTIPCPELPEFAAVSEMHSEEWDVAVQESVGTLGFNAMRDAPITVSSVPEVPNVEAASDVGHTAQELASMRENQSVAFAVENARSARERADRDALSRELGTIDIWDGCDEAPPIEDVIRCMEGEFDE